MSTWQELGNHMNIKIKTWSNLRIHIEEFSNGASVPEEERSKFEAKLSLFRWRGVAVVSATILLFLALCGACVTLIGMGSPGGIQTWHGCLHIEVDVPANSSWKYGSAVAEECHLCKARGTRGCSRRKSRKCGFSSTWSRTAPTMFFKVCQFYFVLDHWNWNRRAQASGASWSIC